MPIKAPPPAEPKENPYLPRGGVDPLVMEVFQGINTATTRPGVDEKQMWWCDGFMPLSPRKLRTMWGLGPAVYTATGGKTIKWFGFCNIGTTPYAILVLSDGSVVAVNTSTGSASTIAAATTITTPTQSTLGLSQWGSQYMLLVTSGQVNGYFYWDGSSFTTVAGVAGTAIEVYSGRVWIVNGAYYYYTAPGSVSDFALSNGGSSTTGVQSTDSTLRAKYTQLLATNGFLYMLGDSSMWYVSGVNSSGTPVVTTYTYQNADPEVGTAWPSTVVGFGRNIIFANPLGVFVSYGAAVTKLSDPLDGVYSTGTLGSFVPSSAKCNVFNYKVWLLLLPVIDPVTGTQRTKLFCWNNSFWWTTEQDVTLTFIASQEIDTILTAWGTDGTSIYRLFQTPSAGFTKTVASRLWDTPGYMLTKQAARFFGIFSYDSITSPSVLAKIDNGVGASYSVTLTGAATTGLYVVPPTAVGQVGELIGMTLTTSAADMTLVSAALEGAIVGYRG